MSMEPSEAVPDLVGRTSARLLAAGVPRAERLAALHLLAILDASTDAAGTVRRPIDDLAAEFDVHPLDALRSMELLESAGAVARHGGGAVTLLGRTDDGLGGMQLADFLEDVRSSFARDGGAVPLAPRRTRFVTRVGAGLVAAAAAASVVVLAPSSPPSTVGSLTAAPTSVDRAAATSSTTAGASASSTTSAARRAATSAPKSPAPPAVDTTVAAAATCPTGSPVAEVVGDILRVTNPTEQDLVVREISIGGQVAAVPLAVAAGSTAVEQLTAPVLGPVDAEVVSWSWTDPSTARACPT